MGKLTFNYLRQLLKLFSSFFTRCQIQFSRWKNLAHFSTPLCWGVFCLNDTHFQRFFKEHLTWCVAIIKQQRQALLWLVNKRVLSRIKNNHSKALPYVWISNKRSTKTPVESQYLCIQIDRKAQKTTREISFHILLNLFIIEIIDLN